MITTKCLGGLNKTKMKSKRMICRWCGKVFTIPQDSENYVSHLNKSHGDFNLIKNGFTNLLQKRTRRFWDSVHKKANRKRSRDCLPQTAEAL